MQLLLHQLKIIKTYNYSTIDLAHKKKVEQLNLTITSIEKVNTQFKNKK